LPDVFHRRAYGGNGLRREQVPLSGKDFPNMLSHVRGMTHRS